MKILFSIFLFNILLFPAYSQMNINRTKLKEANFKFEEYDYNGALEIYEDLIKNNIDDNEILLNSAYCYLKTGKYNKAIEIYSSLEEKYNKEQTFSSDESQDAIYNLAWAYFYIYDFETAKEKFELLIPFSNKKQQKLLEDNIIKCDSAQYYLNNPKEMFVFKPSIINSMQPDYAPVVSAKNDVVYYTSRRKNSLGRPESDGYKCEDIYYSKIINGEFQSPVAVTDINTENHEATTSISPDGKQLFIYKWNNKYRGDIFVSELYNNEWQQPVRMPKSINSKANEVDLCISPDNKTIIFSSDRKGGKGGLDLYIAHLSEDGKWTNIRNIEELNTPGDETGPVYSTDGKLLYFNTNGRYGVGDFDIYKVKVLENGKFGTPVNLGFPLNTTEDDVYFYPTAKPGEAYYSSKQNEGVPNIYIVKIFEQDENNIFVKGYTFDTTQTHIAEYKINDDSVVIANNSYPLNELVYTAIDTAQIYTINNGVMTDILCKIPYNTQITTYNVSENNTENNYTTSEKGKYGFLIKKSEYLVNYTSPNYIYDIFKVNADTDVVEYNAELDTIIIGQVKSEKKTLFDEPEGLSDYQKKEFDILSDFLKQNPALVVDISAYSKNSEPEETDEIYQNLVSQYLFSNGIENERVYFNLSNENAKGNEVFYTIYDTLSIKDYLPVKPLITNNEDYLAVNDINFEINKFQTNKSNEDLDVLAKFLVDNPNAKIAISGYTDTQGNEEYNKKLSEKRANFVKDYLIKKGAKPKQIETQGLGTANQISQNINENGDFIWESLPYNRRVEFKVTTQGENYNLLVNKIEVPKEYQIPNTETVYSIELISGKDKVDFSEFDFPIVQVHWSKGYYSYLYGRYKTMEEAKDELENFKDKYPDAKIIKNNLKY